MNKKIKFILLAGIFIVLCIFGASRLNIQSVQEYQREGQELNNQIMSEETTPVESSKNAVSDSGVTTEEPDSNKTQSHAKGQEKKRDKEPVPTENRHAGKKSPRTTPGQTAVPRATAKPTAGPSVKPPDTIKCSIEIRCDSILSNKDKISADKLEYVPENGVILDKRTITVKKGTNVYQVLAEVCQAKGIALDSEFTPMYGSYYVRGIAHLYETDAGDNSGWIYTVNGKRPEIGASGFLLSEGDAILWRYTCDELD